MVHQLVVLQDPNEDQDDILRANRSREKQYVFDIAFGSNATQVCYYCMCRVLKIRCCTLKVPGKVNPESFILKPSKK